MTSPAQHAIGALKLVALHLDHPAVVPARVLRGACIEAIEHLQISRTHAEELGRFYSDLLAVTPRGSLPYVTMTTDATAPYACVITDASGEMMERHVGKTIAGIVERVRLHHHTPTPARTAEGRGEFGEVQA